MCSTKKTKTISSHSYKPTHHTHRMLSLPLTITPEGLSRENDLKQSLRQSLQLLLSTPRFSTPADLRFGFVFNNLRFEIFNEHEGVVYDSGIVEESHGIEGLYDKKISGSSNNLNTFAAELKSALAQYEQRLSNPSVTMTYIREERLIYVTIKGIIATTREPYTYTTTLNVWK